MKSIISLTEKQLYMLENIEHENRERWRAEKLERGAPPADLEGFVFYNLELTLTKNSGEQIAKLHYHIPQDICADPSVLGNWFFIGLQGCNGLYLNAAIDHNMELNIISTNFEKEEREMAATAFDIFYVVNNITLHAPEVFLCKERIAPSNGSKKKEKRYKQHKKLHPRDESRVVKIYECKDAVLSAYKSEKHFSCEAWGVRGHYRNYKSGKRIFIRPYVKGKKRCAYNGSTKYSLFPQKETNSK